NVAEVMTQEIDAIADDMRAADALERYFGKQQRHRAFPVVRGKAFVGMLERDALLAGLEKGAAQVRDLFGANVPIMALPEETCRMVATRLAVHGLERLPVVIDATTRELIGVVSRSDLIKPSLTLHAEEHQHEKLR